MKTHSFRTTVNKNKEKHKETKQTKKQKYSILCHLHGVLPFIRLTGWDVESDLHKGDFCVVILVKLQSDFVLPCGTLGNVGQWDLKRCVVIDFEG